MFYGDKASDADEARALSYALNHIDIYSNSWGPNDLGFAVAGPGFYTQRVLQDGVEKVILIVLSLKMYMEKFPQSYWLREMHC